VGGGWTCSVLQNTDALEIFWEMEMLAAAVCFLIAVFSLAGEVILTWNRLESKMRGLYYGELIAKSTLNK
jgi:hypothetical protein